MFLKNLSLPALRDQPDGRADAEGNHPVLRICAGETEGPLPQHTLLQTTDQPGIKWKIFSQFCFSVSCQTQQQCQDYYMMQTKGRALGS